MCDLGKLAAPAVAGSSGPSISIGLPPPRAASCEPNQRPEYRNIEAEDAEANAAKFSCIFVGRQLRGIFLVSIL